MMQSSRVRIATVALVLVALTGCAGGDVDDAEDPGADTSEDATTDDTTDDTTDAGETADDTAEEEGAGTSSPTVVVRDIAFQESSVTVQAGTPVTWSNEDGVAHTVTAGTPEEPTGEFDEELPAGGEVQVTLDEPGTYAYWCRIHPSMTAEVVVEQAG
jgi:plastocyanin